MFRRLGSLVVPSLAAALVLCGRAACRADARAPRPIRMVPGEVVVQLRPDFPACVHCLLAHGRSLSTATATPLLDELFAQYGIRHVETVFGGVHAARRRRAVQQRLLGTVGGTAAALPDLSQTYVVRAPPDTDVNTLAIELRRDPNVQWAEPNYLYQAEVLPPAATAEPQGANRSADAPSGLPNDPFLSSSGSWGQSFPDLWGLFQIEAPAAWSRAQGQGVVVAVVDSGLDIHHADLRANVWRNAGEIPGNGIDDDGNGFVDDVYGWDFTHCERDNDYGLCLREKQPGADVRDRLGHGTHVAGIIAAVGDNGIGIIGVAPRAQVMAVKGLNASGHGASADLAAALVYAAENGATVINTSWGGPESDTIRQAIEYVTALGVLVVASAGNDAVPLQQGVSPADLPDVVAVGATTHTDASSFFSNFGGSLALVAPGGGEGDPQSAPHPERSILSLLARNSAWARECRPDPNCAPDDPENCPPLCGHPTGQVGARYIREAGTSMAAPHVSGVAALVRSRHPEFTRQQVRQALVESADDLGAPTWDPTFGYGRVNARRAVAVDALPVAQITVPQNQDKIRDWQLPLVVQGNALSPGTLFDHWRLALRAQGEAAGGLIAEGSEPVVNAPLATVAAAMLQPGTHYVLDLEVADRNGHTAHDAKTFLISNPQFAVLPVPDPGDEGGYHQRLSGDGTRMMFTQSAHGGSTVALFDAVSRELLSVSEGAAVQGDALTTDGRLLAFDGFLPDGTNCGQLAQFVTAPILYDVDARSFMCLPAAVDLAGAAIDADGTHIAFTSRFHPPVRPEDQDGTSELFVLDRRDDSIRQVTDVPAGPVPFGVTAGVGSPSVSANASRIAFIANVSLDSTDWTGAPGAAEVFIYDGDRGTVRQLTGCPGTPPDARCPSLSGDGMKVAYLSGSEGVFVMDLASGSVDRVVDPSGGPSCPLLSTDGKQLAFEAAMDLDPTVENEDLSREVFLLNLDTGTAAQVTDTQLIPDCNPSIHDCGPEFGAIDATGDTLSTGNAFEQKALPLPLFLSLTRIVRRRGVHPPPRLDVPSLISVPVGATVHTPLRATDPDGYALTFFVQRVPFSPQTALQYLSGYQLTDHGDGTADLAMRPQARDMGEFVLRVAAFDEAGGVAEADVRLLIGVPPVSPSGTPSATVTRTPTATSQPTPSATPSPSATTTGHPSATSTPAATRTATSSTTPTPTPTATPSKTSAAGVASDSGCAMDASGRRHCCALLALAVPGGIVARRRRGARVQPTRRPAGGVKISGRAD